VHLDGSAEWRQGDALIVDGRRVRANGGTRFKRGARSLGSISLGDEAKATGTRQRDGSVLAKEIEAKPNGDALSEKDLRSAFDAGEKQWLKSAKKCGEGNTIETFFFSDHSQALRRAKSREAEIALNHSTDSPR
jgi:hypothetical protein